MSELIDRQAFIEQERKVYCENCDRRQGMKNGKLTFCYEIGDAPCRACWGEDILTDLEDFPAAPRWHRVEDGLPVKGEIVIVSDGKHTWDIGQYHCLFSSDDRTKWWWKGHTIKTVKWWMRKKDALPEPPKEDKR